MREREKREKKRKIFLLYVYQNTTPRPLHGWTSTFDVKDERGRRHDEKEEEEEEDGAGKTYTNCLEE